MPEPIDSWLRRIGALVLLTLVAACGGSGEPDPLADGRSVYGRMCAACHGNRGQGGAGPPLATVIETFPSCAGHLEWVTLGSAGWLDEHGDAYGAPGKPVTGGMPAFGATLTAEQIAAVAAFERVRYGDAPVEAALVECGIGGAGG